MKSKKLKTLGFLATLAIILAGNLIGINALAIEEGGTVTKDGTGDTPNGVLVGYMPVVERVKTGEHLEYWGWIGAPFARLVSDYKEFLCCKKTLRAMDGCKDLPKCPNS